MRATYRRICRLYLSTCLGEDMRMFATLIEITRSIKWSNMSFKRPLSPFQMQINVIGRCMVHTTLQWAALNFPLLVVPQLCGAAVIEEGSRVRVMSDHTCSITVEPSTIRLGVALSGSLRNVFSMFIFEALVSTFVGSQSDHAHRTLL